MTTLKKVLAPFKFVWNVIAHEPMVVTGAVVAGINAAQDHTWKGYALALGLALFRNVVSPALPKFGPVVPSAEAPPAA